MLVIETLFRKNYFKKSDGTLLLDFTKSSWKFTSEPDIRDIIYVTKEFQMRPDLLAQAAYGDHSKLDYLLKYNGISNPLSLKEGDILLIPDEAQMRTMLITPKKDENDADKKSKKVNLKAVSSKENARIEYLKNKLKNQLLKSKNTGDDMSEDGTDAGSNGTGLPPNVNKSSDQNVKFKDGKIIFGEDVTTFNAANCPETLSRTRVKQKLLKTKIFE